MYIKGRDAIVNTSCGTIKLMESEVVFYQGNDKKIILGAYAEERARQIFDNICLAIHDGSKYCEMPKDKFEPRRQKIRY